MVTVSQLISRASFPLFDLWDRGDRLKEWKRLSASQWWSRTDIEALQLRRLQHQVAHAWATVPFYREFWGSEPRIDSLDGLRSLPILTKAHVRDAGKRLLSSAIPADTLIQSKTGGSTGTSLVLYFDHDCQQHRNAAALRSDTWAGWRPGDWIGGLWGSPELPANLKQKARNWLRDRMEYLDTMRLDAASMDRFISLMRQKHIDALFGHAHSLFILADYINRNSISVPAPHAIVSTSMMLIAQERAVIERAFRCKVSDRYGCEEVGLIAAECSLHQGLHVNCEHTLVEILDENETPCELGTVGRVIVSDLENHGMPLIRYEVGDMSAWSARNCECRRGLPTLERVIGRQADCLIRADGSLVAGVSLVERTLTAIEGIAQLQLEQTSRSEVIARYVPDNARGDFTSAQLRDAITRDLGSAISVTVVKLDRLPQERNGKYRFAIRRC